MPVRLHGKRFALGCDIGATKISVTLGYTKGVVADRILDSTARMQNPDELVAELASMVNRLLKKNKLDARDCVGVGVAFAGPVESASGTVLVGTNLKGWVSVPLQKLLHDRLSLPVAVQNDANAGAIGEYMYGGQASGDMMYITISTGIGGGLIINGVPYEGSHSIAGEIGHTTVIPNGPRCGCGKLGCLEAVASGLSIERTAAERMSYEETTLNERAKLNGGRVTSAMVFEEARKGDMLSLDLVDTACRYLGFAIAGAVMLLSLSAVVLGGGMAKEGEYLRSRVEFYARKELARGMNQSVQILVSRMPDGVVDLGALEIAFDRNSEDAQA